jgi:hypothetical protein
MCHVFICCTLITTVPVDVFPETWYELPYFFHIVCSADTYNLCGESNTRYAAKSWTELHILYEERFV